MFLLYFSAAMSAIEKFTLLFTVVIIMIHQHSELDADYIAMCYTYLNIIISFRCLDGTLFTERMFQVF